FSLVCLFFFSSRRRHTRSYGDWSSDVCSSDLDGDEVDRKLIELRRMYEPYVNSLAQFLFMTLPPWIHEGNAMDNWQTSAWERNPMVFASSPAPVNDHDHSKQTSAD